MYTAQTTFSNTRELLLEIVISQASTRINISGLELLSSTLTILLRLKVVLFCAVLLTVLMPLLSYIRSSQLSQGKDASPIFMPEDGYNWQIAKACFESAEFM